MDSNTLLKKQLLHFFNNVTIRLCIYDWKLVFINNSSEGQCHIREKTIYIGLCYNNHKELLLHEIAHIGTCRFCNNGHHIAFWKRFEDLMRKFLPNDTISESMQNYKLSYKKITYNLNNMYWAEFI